MIGAIGGFITIGTDILLDKLRVDDPVSAVAVHGASGAWVSSKCNLMLRVTLPGAGVFISLYTM